MIPATRCATPASLTVVRNVQGQVARSTFGTRPSIGGKNIVAQHGRGMPQHTRSFSRTTPAWSSLNFVFQPKETEKEDVIKREDMTEHPLGRPEHAVISTFDLFSIGGLYSNPSPT